MKNLMKYLSVVIVALFCIGFTACNSDDDEEGSGKGNGTMTVNSKKVSVDYGYFNIDVDYRNNKEMWFSFCSWDFLTAYLNPTSVKNYPTTIHDLEIAYDIDAAQTGIESVTIPGGSYHLYVAVDVTEDDEGWQAETRDNDTSNGPLTIKRDGNTITVTIENANVYDYDDYGYATKSPTPFSFTFKGPIKQLPEEYIK